MNNATEKFWMTATFKKTDDSLNFLILPMTSSDNLLTQIKRLAGYGGLQYVNIYKTKKKAEEIKAFWEECEREKNTCPKILKKILTSS